MFDDMLLDMMNDGVTIIRVNPESTSVVEPRTPVELAVDEVLCQNFSGFCQHLLETRRSLR